MNAATKTTTASAPPSPDLGALLADPTRVAELPDAATVYARLDEADARYDELEAGRRGVEVVRRALLRRARRELAVQPVPAPAVARHVTQAEAAALSGLPLRTVRFLTRTGRVPSLKRGRHRLLLPAELHRYLAERREKGLAVGVILDVSSPSHDRRRGPRGAQATRSDPGAVC